MLFFAAAAEATGWREQTLTIPAGSTIAEAVESVTQDCHSFNTIQSICAFALDERLVQGTEEVVDGCTIAVLPPVSGG